MPSMTSDAKDSRIDGLVQFDFEMIDQVNATTS